MASPTNVFTVSQSEDASTLYLTDATGDYDVSTNPGGYGGPNTARTNLALIAVAAYKAISGDVSLTISSYDPEIVTTWTVTSITLDGHYEFLVYAIPKSGTEPSPVSGDFRYDFSTNALERYNGSSWVSATINDLDTYDYTHTTVDYPVLADMQLALNNLNKLAISGCQTESKSDIQKMIMDTQTMFDGSLALFAEGSYAKAQLNIEKYQSRVDYINSLI